ncbi:MAG TPA: hypothetical protein VLT45_31640 [Kofleriaceae bacterium]|nr:hypothetical protein [Kofleriaceae bacterium]
MSLRPCVLMVTAACATAGRPQQAPNDAPAGQSDGARSGDGPQQHIDGGIDAPPGSCPQAFSGALATWSFTGQTGTEASVSASATATGVTAGAVSRSASLTVPTGGQNSINASNWPTAAQLDAQKYYTFIVTPPSGCQMDLSSLSIDALSSGTGPTMAVVATSDDSYGQTSTVSTTAPSTPALHVSGATTMIELRVYGFSASSASGTLRIQNTLTLNGALR